jgi:alkylated DNA repair dioxygenase AlkB
LIGSGYGYKPATKTPLPWDDPVLAPVLELKQISESATGEKFSQALCNLYADGEVGIGGHHDALNPLMIASVSFGAVRVMKFSQKGKDSVQVPLANGSLILLTDHVNSRYKHEITTTKKILEPRISATFRRFAGTVGAN